MAKYKYDILKDTFCIYCRVNFLTPKELQNHVKKDHKGTYADLSIQKAKAKAKIKKV